MKLQKEHASNATPRNWWPLHKGKSGTPMYWVICWYMYTCNRNHMNTKCRDYHIHQNYSYLWNTWFPRPRCRIQDNYSKKVTVSKMYLSHSVLNKLIVAISRHNRVNRVHSRHILKKKVSMPLVKLSSLDSLWFVTISSLCMIYQIMYSASCSPHATGLFTPILTLITFSVLTLTSY